MKAKQGSVLIGLLWCLVLLSVMVITLLHGSRVELRTAKNHTDRIQAHYLAIAGIEKAKAVIYHDAKKRRESARNHDPELYDAPQYFKDISLGRGLFKVFRPSQPTEAGPEVYGVRDQESRLNVNTASLQDLQRIPNMPPELASAIIDFRDQDNTANPGGAEVEYYMGSAPPYLPKNAPFDSLKELLLVRGVTRDEMFGEDHNINGLLDPNENDGPLSLPSDNQNGSLESGWSDYLCVASSVQNLNAKGEERINVQEADESKLLEISGMTSQIAKAIVSSRGQNQLRTVLDLLDVRPQQPGQPNQPPPNQPRNSGGRNRPNQPPLQDSPINPSSEPLISEDLLLQIADKLTTNDAQEIPGVVNVNTAPVHVLHCLPGISTELAQAIVLHRQSSGYLQSVESLIRVPGMSRDLVKSLSPRITVRSETFQVNSEGLIPSTGARKRIMAIVRIESGSIKTLFQRDDL